MFEILSSNIWSPDANFAIAYSGFLRSATAAVVMPILFVMMGWILMSRAKAICLPPITVWLYIHIGRQGVPRRDARRVGRAG
jgi:hypothetical protein